MIGATQRQGQSALHQSADAVTRSAAINNLKDHMNSVKITAQDDGTYTVEAEEPEMDMEAEGMEDEASEPSTQVATIDEAFDLARQMLDQGSASEPMIEGEDSLDFEKGFAGIRGE